MRHARSGGVANNLGTSLDILPHGGTAHDNGMVTNSNVTNDPGLTSQNGIVANYHTTGQTNLGNNQTTLSDDDVVGNLHQVVDLGTSLDPGAAKPGTIDADIRADLHVVVDLDNADLGDLLVYGAWDEAIAVAANNGTTMNDDAFAKYTTLEHDNIGVQPAAGTKINLTTDITTSTDNGTGADTDASFDDRVGTDMHIIRNHDIGINDSTAMNTGRRRKGGGCKLRNDGAESGRGVFDNNPTAVFRWLLIEVRLDNDNASFRRQDLRRVLGIAKKRQMMGLSFSKRRDTGNATRFVTVNGTIDEGGNLDG